jgi:hypothetical protein
MVNNTGIYRNGNLLSIDKDNLIDLISHNIDSKSVDIDGKLLHLIFIYYGRFSVKQFNWILEKVKYICRHNKNYKEYKGITDIQLL